MPESYTDRHLEMAQQLRDVLEDRLPPAKTVERAFDPDIDYKAITGRIVYVFPTTEQDAQRVSRAAVLTDYGFAVVTANRYTDAAESDPGDTVPQAWTDGECGWVHENVYAVLNDAVKRRDRLIPTAVPQACKLSGKYDPDRLKAKVFWSVVEVTFRELRRA